MRLPSDLRDKLKIPLGKLILEQNVTRENIKANLPKDCYIITVGDRTTEKMISLGLDPSLQIIDEQEKRVKRSAPHASGTLSLFTCVNPSAEITLESIETIKKAFSITPPVRIVVYGEEDLLVIPVCIHAPDNSVVLYGQPNEGLVIVPITKEIRNKAQSFLDQMLGNDETVAV